MKVLLIINKKHSEDLRVLVNVQTRDLKEKVLALLEANKDREAFDLLVKKAEVDSYLAPGEKASIRPALTLIEDLL